MDKTSEETEGNVRTDNEAKGGCDGLSFFSLTASKDERRSWHEGGSLDKAGEETEGRFGVRRAEGGCDGLSFFSVTASLKVSNGYTHTIIISIGSAETS